MQHLGAVGMGVREAAAMMGPGGREAIDFSVWTLRVVDKAWQAAQVCLLIFYLGDSGIVYKDIALQCY